MLVCRSSSRLNRQFAAWDIKSGGDMATIANLLQDEALVGDMAETINHFLDTRFEGLTMEMREILADVCLEMFEAGANWCEAAGHVPDKSAIIMNSGV